MSVLLRAPVLTDKEERRLAKLRTKLFDKESKDWKTLIRDESPAEVYSDETGFSIYVGNAEHASDLLTLEIKGVTFVLNMAAGEPLCNMTEEVYGPAYRCLRVSAGDMPGYNLSQHFDDTWTFLEEARRRRAKVLVHCVAGVSRSATVVIAYLMQLRGWSLETAGTHVSQKRPKVYPNLGFMKQLELHQTKLSGTIGKL
ncbi:dual specificity protein phosphatase 13A-like [Halichondria panicea]|uniref:dual specificity protein phosphatase 13A-like n=1 Tax=Halichondria panicea TaxID=6063 RepID=UPI00312B5FF2